MDKPILLIESTEDGLQVNPEAKAILENLETTVVVIGIVGDYRSGKSFLLNCLAGRQENGFELGDSVVAHTKGIWIWCQPHPFLKNTTIIFMDSEGLQDPDKNDYNYDMNIITLCFLLSSTLIYNTTGRIDGGLIDKLSFVSEVTKHIQVRSGKHEAVDDEDISLQFPYLLVVIRDFFLKLSKDKQEITPTEYFYLCLKTDERRPKSFNQPRRIISQYFPPKKCSCFVLPIPTPKHNWLSTLHLAPKQAIAPEFIEKCSELKSFLTSISKSKTVGCLQNINGHLFLGLVECYLEAIEGGEMPCIESALKLTAMRENQRILDLCMKGYETRIQLLPFPLSQDELSAAHKNIVNELTLTYKDRIIFDDLFVLREKLQDQLSSAYNTAVALNESSSAGKCRQILTDLYKPIKENIKEYMKQGGYAAHRDQLDEIKRKYMNIPKKGVKSESALHEFIQQLEEERNTIIAADLEFSVLAAKEEAFQREIEQIELREKMLQAEIERSKRREQELQELNESIQRTFEEEMNEKLRQQEERFDAILAEKDESFRCLEETSHSEISDLTRRIDEFEKNKKCIIL
uniref:Interferon-induced guanylate-binding protein 1 n=1 Tax=Hemiscolopendra marginata TaxID=943146 RepID=A0A646QD21_9MYRI